MAQLGTSDSVSRELPLAPTPTDTVNAASRRYGTRACGWCTRVVVVGRDEEADHDYSVRRHCGCSKASR